MKNCFYEKLGPTDLAIADLCDYYGHGMIITRINVPKGVFRGTGIGTKLLNAITNEADVTCTKLFLEISPSDGLNYAQLQEWYERHGFKPWKGIFKRNPK